MKIDGNWRIELDMPAGPREGTVRLTTVGKAFSGSWSDGVETLLFDDGRVEGENLHWTVLTPIANGEVDVKFDGTVQGNSMTGTVEVGGEGAAGLFRAERLKSP